MRACSWIERFKCGRRKRHSALSAAENGFASRERVTRRRQLDAFRGVDVGAEQVADVERQQEFLVVLALQPLLADQFLGCDHFAFGEAYERVHREEMGLVGDRRLRIHRARIDHDAGIVLRRRTQHQRDVRGLEGFAQQLERAFPGWRLQRSVVDRPQQSVELPEIRDCGQRAYACRLSGRAARSGAGRL